VHAARAAGLIDTVIVMCVSVCAGEMDHLPEVAFYMVGAIEEVVKKAERLAEERR